MRDKKLLENCCDENTDPEFQLTKNQRQLIYDEEKAIQKKNLEITSNRSRSISSSQKWKNIEINLLEKEKMKKIKNNQEEFHR